MADETPDTAKAAKASAPPQPAPAESAKPADPTDDLVERKHTLTVGRKKLAYTSQTGRIVLREEVIEEGKASGFKPKATVFVTAYTPHGFTRDIESVGEVIRLWTSRNGRWMSPKFLAGESYGTLRAAGLAAHLQSRHGMFLNGIILVSSVLDLGTIVFSEGNDVPYALYLPTYAAVAHYHGKHPGRTLRQVIDEAEAYAAGDYPRVLARGPRLSVAERRTAVAEGARLTGLRRGDVGPRA